jgi:hypothetical protein
MSTRCQIGIYRKKETDIKEYEVLLYRHSDGYPSGVLPDIMPFLENFKKTRGIDDTEYAGARLMQYMTNLCDKNEIEWAEERMKRNGNNTQSTINDAKQIKQLKSFGSTTGYGISKEFHGDIEFFYKINPETIQVYTTNIWNGLDGADTEIKLLAEMPIEGYKENDIYINLIENN